MAIYVNQVGYYPTGGKTAVFTTGHRYELIRKEDQTVVHTGELSEEKLEEASGDAVRIADFADFSEQGTYYLQDETGIQSVTFMIKEELYHDLQMDVLRAFYFQRCGCALEEKYAGIYHHDCCHNTLAAVLGSEGEKHDVHGGWHDAGDYGRYTTAAAVALAHMLYGYQLFPGQWQEENHIPESGNGTPDILNECRYELDWLLRMQREDGGVYHKLTTFRHANFVLPEFDNRELFLFPVSSLATADFAAVMSLASRVYAQWDTDFAVAAQEAALRAWGWLNLHPQFLFEHNPEGCNTGEYGDDCDVDERAWAAAELWVTTGETQYRTALMNQLDGLENLHEFGWVDVTGLAGMAILTAENSSDSVARELRQRFLTAFEEESVRMDQLADGCGYGVAMSMEDYGWGSNMVVENRAMISALMYLMTGERRYVECVIAQMDYLLGKNAMDISYVTGYGEHAFSHPHNRPTVALGDKSVMPGWVSGGPNREPCDEKAEWLITPGTPPMKCYIDQWECYSLNEITIYWNSPVVFLTAFLQEACKKDGMQVEYNNAIRGD